jgi:hypothetical protein
VEAAGGILFVVATVIALVWANSPWSDAYDQLWATPVEFVVGSLRFEEDLLHIVNDGLMALFFFVVGMEIKRELVTGELRDRRNVALPAMAALGGMVIPAVIYAVINLGGDGTRGWGIPMATDIAFALGVVALLGDRVPGPLKVFLLTSPSSMTSAPSSSSPSSTAKGSRRSRSSWPPPSLASWSCSVPCGSPPAPCTSSLVWRCGWPCSSPACTPRSPAS